MYKVVIIDDEPIIVEGLQRAINWEQWNCEVVGVAYNGIQGLEEVKSKKPDILFSDISMSRMDGLTMIAAIKTEFSNMQITILTGYRDFDYAQQAIRLGVTRFLLKPSKLNELEEAIETMIHNLEQIPKVQTQAVETSQEVTQENKEKEEELETSEATNFIVKNALNYIEKNYAQKLKLSDVADQIYVSQWHLSKLLNKYTGQNFSELLNSVRIEKAKELLCDPSLRVGDIADAVGFMDMAHFSRVFKKIVGTSAKDYRNSRLN